jgi:hypothetical protein
MNTCGVCGKQLSNSEMENGVSAGYTNRLAMLLGPNAKRMPNLIQGRAMKCNNCGTLICINCASSAATRAGAGMIQHSDCGGWFESL